MLLYGGADGRGRALTLRTQLPQLRPLKPRYVVWGDGTSDEMCLGVVVWSRQSV